MYSEQHRAQLSRGLAAAFLAGSWDESGLVERANDILDAWPRWIPRVSREVLDAYHRPPADRPRELVAFIALALERRRSPRGSDAPPNVRRWHAHEPAMGRRRWPVPEIASVGALAEFLGLEYGVLRWFADTRRLERTVDEPRLRNYSYGAVARRQGPPRVIERPKSRLKAVQRHLLHGLLDWIPAHPAAHGFTRGRSVVSHAREHTGQVVVLGFDLEDFFASVEAARVFGIFRTAGYPEAVSYLLTGLTTNVVPVDVWHSLAPAPTPDRIDAQHRLGRRLADPHLPQGAPTSPALANLAAFRLDRRLSGLAAALGARYSRYADDLTFSGPASLLRGADGVRSTVESIAREEGFAVNPRKSTLVTRAGRQTVCGIVVNERTNIARSEYDRLRATIHNATRLGPDSQNREGVADLRAHLAGRVAWVEQLHPARGRRLRRALDGVPWEWPDTAGPSRHGLS